MKRSAASGLALALVGLTATALSACGSSSSAGGSGAGSKPAATSGDTVALRSLEGLGNVLVDSKGFTFYSPNEERSGGIRCTGSCTSIWVPLTLPKSSSGPTASSNLTAKLGTLKRPDGMSQVTFDRKPLYRFVQDRSPGKASGNGLSDRFGGQSFTWHVAGSSTSQPAPATGGGGYHY
jgi:predicted lipoprotein with Yx(FWY)xxD motif